MPSARLIVVRALAVVVLAAGLYAGARPLGPLPPLGSFLDPANGVWAVARRTALPTDARRTIPGLSAPVDIRYDDRGVPHIFAATLADAQRALGFVVAQDRLFQMELQTRATAGTLTELVGPSTLNLDRQQRHLSLAATAERTFAALNAGSPTGVALRAYADGVNAWIDGMSAADLPLEYRLLDARPMRWEPVYSLYLLRRMGYTLAYQTDDLRRVRVAGLVGEAAADALFPAKSPIQDPIQPGKGRYPRYDWKKVPPPVAAGRRDGGPAGRSTAFAPEPEREFDALGSNNWAVAPARSATGHALLAGDPHLDLTLPSIWYEAHLVVGGIPTAQPPNRLTAQPPNRPTLDVYGVTIPGVPGVVIGFNRNAAWSLTNTEADVADYYTEQLDSPTQPTRYLRDGEWYEVSQRVEAYRGPHGTVLAVDTVRSTDRGPIIQFDGQSLSLRWTVNESGSEVGALLAGAEARNANEFLRLTQGFSAPAQNILVADRQGNIAIRSTGRFPYRPGNGSGMVIRDGTRRASDWQGDWPVRNYPNGRNPESGFLSSANQQPIDPPADSTYLGYDWDAGWRAVRINGLLRGDSQVTVEQMRRWQTDPGSARADFFVPYFLAAAGPIYPAGRRAGGPAVPGADVPPSRRPAELLAQWDRRYTRDNTRAVLFEAAMEQLALLTWEELEDSTGRRVATPRDVILAELMQDSSNAWWDRRETVEREDRDAVLRLALHQGLAEARQRYGEPDAGGWRWDRVRHANIYHLLRFPALSALGLPIQGGRSTLNPSSGEGTQGASWRMVVDLGDSTIGITALGTYPGGQSGNPVSPRYLDRLPKWIAGELDTLRVPRGPADLAGRTSARLTLVPESSP